MHSTASSTTVVRFGVFEADLRSGELRRSGAKIKIQDLPFQALKLLLSRPNEVLSRDDFRQALWPDDVFVDFDRGITSAMNRLRDALGDSAENPVFIETVGRRGYRWIAPTHLPDPPTVAPAIAGPVMTPRPRQWKWVLVLPVLALVFAAWIYRPAFRSARASSASRPGSALSSSGRLHHPANPEAEDFYLKGRYYWNKRTPDDLTKALDSFTQAIVHDPGYAAAYVGLADCYNLLREYSTMPATEAYPRAYAAAKKAVELDDQSSEAHASLAFVSFFGRWDAATAEREYRRAIELDPHNALAHHWYASYLSTLGRYPESLAEIERAQALDPNSRSVLADKGFVLCGAGRCDEGIALLKQLETAEPDFLSPHRYLKSIYAASRDYPNYLAELKKEALLTHDRAALATADAAEKAFATGGPRAMFEALQQQQRKLYDQGLFSPYLLAETCSWAGNKQEALQYLRAAYEKHADGIAQMGSNPLFNNLHNEPAFRKLLADAGLPPQS